MTRSTARLLLWTPRIFGVAVALFIAVFALDAVSERRPLVETALAFAVHLIPAMVLLAIVAVASRWEWVGGVTFVALAVAYAVTVGRGHVDWILVISGPMLVVGLLFLCSWSYHDVLRDASSGARTRVDIRD